MAVLRYSSLDWEERAEADTERAGHHRGVTRQFAEGTSMERTYRAVQGSRGLGKEWKPSYAYQGEPIPVGLSFLAGQAPAAGGATVRRGGGWNHARR